MIMEVKSRSDERQRTPAAASHRCHLPNNNYSGLGQCRIVCSQRDEASSRLDRLGSIGYTVASASLHGNLTIVTSSNAMRQDNKCPTEPDDYGLHFETLN